MGTAIRQIACYLPETILDNARLAKEFTEWNAEKIEEKIGVRERHVVKEGETALDLAIKASEALFEQYDKTRIDFLLFCTESPDYLVPPNACILQNRLGLRTSIGAFDYNLACSGYVYGLALAKGLIATGVAHNVLLVTAETYSKLIHPKDKGNRTIFGDAATATILERSDNESILECVFGTDGSGHDKLIVPCGGARTPVAVDAELQENPPGNFRTCNNLYMDGPEIFNFTIEAVPALVKEVLQKNRLTMEEVDYVIFHQANKYIVEYLRKKLRIPSEKFYLDMLHVGNTVSSTIPIALKNSFEQGILAPGKKALLAGFGAGYSWGATIIEL